LKPDISPRWLKDCEQAHKDLAQNLPAVFAAASKHSSKDGGAQWAQHRSYQLAELQTWCEQRQPRVILELGSGWSTFVLSRYAAEFGARLVTVEENAEWAQVEWFISPTVVKDTVRYQSLPELAEIDLLYVDGPASDFGGRPIPGDDANILAARCLVKHVLFDIRRSSVDLFREVPGYHFEPGGTYPWAKPEYLRPRRHHSWFWRK
jgi:hypothetical protein